jgi:4-hydroxy-4-methyl-2-oxoglutarate aldolase
MATEPEAPIGAYRPARVATLDAPLPDPQLVAALRGVTGLSSAFSDELDGLGYRTAVPAAALPPLRPGDLAIGRAITLRYLPTRRLELGNGRLAHLSLFGLAAPGDVAVIVAPDGIDGSVLGGRAAAAAVRAGIVGCVVAGAVRDLDEIEESGLPLWTRARTPATGRGRLEAVEINGPVEVAGVQVLPGDVVVADSSGIVAVPSEHFAELARRILGA